MGFGLVRTLFAPALQRPSCAGDEYSAGPSGPADCEGEGAMDYESIPGTGRDTDGEVSADQAQMAPGLAVAAAAA